jgi:hypothetical protein
MPNSSRTSWSCAASGLPVQDLILGGDAGVPDQGAGQDGRLGGEQVVGCLSQA